VDEVVDDVETNESWGTKTLQGIDRRTQTHVEVDLQVASFVFFASDRAFQKGMALFVCGPIVDN
jgi:hypothetical protein